MQYLPTTCHLLQPQGGYLPHKWEGRDVLHVRGEACVQGKQVWHHNPDHPYLLPKLNSLFGLFQFFFFNSPRWQMAGWIPSKAVTLRNVYPGIQAVFRPTHLPPPLYPTNPPPLIPTPRPQPVVKSSSLAVNGADLIGGQR